MYFISFQHETVTFLILPVTARISPFLKQLYLLIKEPPRTTNWINYSVIHIMVKQANDLCHFFSLVKILWPFLFTAERRVFIKAPLSEARSQVWQPYSWEYLTVDLLTNVHTMNYRLIFVGWSECLHIDSRKRKQSLASGSSQSNQQNEKPLPVSSCHWSNLLCFWDLHFFFNLMCSLLLLYW